MPSYRIHSCDSAQQEVFERLSKGEKGVMVHCDHQKKGEGRRLRPWFSAKRAVAMSFDLDPNSKLSLTSLELGVLSCEFLRSLGLRVGLKWPNDLLLESGRKCGGILIQSKQGALVAGIGINLFSPNEEVPDELKGKLGGLYENDEQDPWELAQNLYAYICANRLSAKSVLEKWKTLCYHLNAQVTALEDAEKIKGKFLGIGEDGEALIETPLEIKRVYNASLVL